MGLEAKIKVPAFKNVLKILKAVREEAIIQFRPDGMTVRMVDADRARMIQVRIDPVGSRSMTVIPTTSWLWFSSAWMTSSRL